MSHPLCISSLTKKYLWMSAVFDASIATNITESRHKVCSTTHTGVSRVTPAHSEKAWSPGLDQRRAQSCRNCLEAVGSKKVCIRPSFFDQLDNRRRAAFRVC